jgi:tRNA A37 threonylcarbamoyladenosine dehydratase
MEPQKIENDLSTENIRGFKAKSQKHIVDALDQLKQDVFLYLNVTQCFKLSIYAFGHSALN